jgi:hypothetical protein
LAAFKVSSIQVNCPGAADVEALGDGRLFGVVDARSIMEKYFLYKLAVYWKDYGPSGILLD